MRDELGPCEAVGPFEAFMVCVFLSLISVGFWYVVYRGILLLFGSGG